jgi:hypothetical protein
MPDRESEQGGGGGNSGKIIGAVALIMLFLVVAARLIPAPTDMTYVHGVKVVSEIPLESLQARRHIALSDDVSSKAQMTCKFGLSAVSRPDPQGYVVEVGGGDTGIYLGSDSAYIKGASEEDILRACHIFACIRDGIDCPGIDRISGLMGNAASISVIIDEDVGGAGARGYAEIMGALSFYQSRVVDVNRDGIISQAEVDLNDFFIYPFVKSGDMCEAQSFVNAVQNWSGRNETLECSRISPAIVLLRSKNASIRFDSDRIVLEGDDEELHTASVIVRDTIDPSWIRRLYGFD